MDERRLRSGLGARPERLEGRCVPLARQRLDPRRRGVLVRRTVESLRQLRDRGSGGGAGGNHTDRRSRAEASSRSSSSQPCAGTVRSEAAGAAGCGYPLVEVGELAHSGDRDLPPGQKVGALAPALGERHGEPPRGEFGAGPAARLDLPHALPARAGELIRQCLDVVGPGTGIGDLAEGGFEAENRLGVAGEAPAVRRGGSQRSIPAR